MMHFQTTTTTPRTVRTSGRRPTLAARIMDLQAVIMDAIEKSEAIAQACMIAEEREREKQAEQLLTDLRTIAHSLRRMNQQ